MKNSTTSTLVLFGGLLLSAHAYAAEPAPNAAAMPVEMQQMMKTYSPEMRQKVMALSPDLKATIQKLHANHPIRAKETTLRQVMHEILSEYQAILAMSRNVC